MQDFHSNTIQFLRDWNFIMSAFIIPLVWWVIEQYRENKRKKKEEQEWKERMEEAIERLERLTQKTDEYREAIKIVLRGTLKQKAALYLERGVISSDELDAFHVEYEKYRELGGNGVAEALAKQVDNLRVDDTGIVKHDAKVNYIKDLFHLLEHNHQLVEELQKVLGILDKKENKGE